MIHSWVFINRGAAINRLVIPGWSMLPHYFSTLIPSDNLIILNPFITGKSKLNTYIQSELVNEDVAVKWQSMGQVMQTKINHVFIFSMGLQWVYSHAPQLFKLNCDVVAPSITYHQKELDKLILSLKKSLPITLKAFYRQCFQSKSDWLWWKDAMLKSHIAMSNPEALIYWLDDYGRLKVTIPDTKNITIWFDPNDKIGQKPSVTSDNSTVFQIKGHILKQFKWLHH